MLGNGTTCAVVWTDASTAEPVSTTTSEEQATAVVTAAAEQRVIYADSSKTDAARKLRRDEKLKSHVYTYTTSLVLSVCWGKLGFVRCLQVLFTSKYLV